MQPQTNSIARSQKLGVGCIVAFMIPFFAGGSMSLLSGIRALQRGVQGADAIVPIIIGAVFITVSISIVLLMISGTRSLAANAALRAQNPDKPWLWREEWSDGVIVSHGGAQSMLMAFMAVFWNAIALPSAYFALSSTDLREKPVVFVVLIFPIVGVILFLTAVYQILRARKYGQSRVMLSHIPISIGSTCRGEIVTHVQERPESGFALKLQCLHRVTTASGRSRSTRETELWREDQVVSGLTAIPTVDGFRVPFNIEIPGDLKPTDDTIADDQVVWRLSIDAETPGIDYSAQFDVPVFVTSETQHEVKRFVPTESEVTAWTPSAKSRIAILPDEIRIAAHARLREAFSFAIFSVIWFGAIWLMLRVGAPIFFPIVFTLFGLILVYAMFDAILGRTSIRVDSGGLAVRRTWLGAGFTNTIGAAHIKRVEANPTPNSASYEIDVISHGDRKTQIARYIPDRHDAEMLAARLDRIVSPRESFTAGTPAVARS